MSNVELRLHRLRRELEQTTLELEAYYDEHGEPPTLEMIKNKNRIESLISQAVLSVSTQQKQSNKAA